MLRSLSRALTRLLSILIRLAFVLAVCGFAAVFALGGGLPADITELGAAVGGVDDIGALGDVGIGAAEGSGMASQPSSVPSSSTAELNGTRLEYLIHQEVNEERVEHGRSKLEFDTELRTVARYHSADMARNNYFAHVSPDGETLGERYQKFGYQCRVKTGLLQYVTGGGNILYTYYETPVMMGNTTVYYDTPKELARGIVNGWMNSTSHRKNLLKPYWEREAIGVYIEQTNGRMRVYATQNFC
jgi:uncharacterized protein YkwD